MEIITYQGAQLPDTLEDLTQFVLVGQARLNAYMLKIRAVNKLSVAQEIRDQTLKEAQEISTALIAAEQRIGEILLSIPKASGARTDLATSAPNSEEVKTKGETISEMGYSRKESADYQTMAKNPEVVQRVIEDALSRGDVVTKTQVLKEIKAAKEEARKQAEEEIQKTLEDARPKTEAPKGEEAEADEAYQLLKERLRKAQEEADEVKRLLQEERVEGIKARKRHEDNLVNQIAALESQLEAKEVEVREIIPEEYQKAKREADTLREELRQEQRKADEKQKENLRLQDRVKELEGITQEGLDTQNLNENVIYFCTTCNNFIGNVGGLVWLTSRIDDMPERERGLFLKAAYSFRDWATAFIANLEGVTQERDADIGRSKLLGVGAGKEDQAAE